MPDNNYNITVTYVTNLGHTTSVLNNTFSNYNINSTQTLNLKVNITRLFVNITDVDNMTQYDLMPYWAEHYIVGLFNQSTGSPLANATTSVLYESDGVNWLIAELWWHNSSDNHIVKVFYDPHELEARLGRLGWEGRIRRSGKFFMYGCFSAPL